MANCAEGWSQVYACPGQNKKCDIYCFLPDNHLQVDGLLPSSHQSSICSELHGTIKERNVPGMLQDHWSSSAKTYAISTHRDKITKGGVGHMGRMGEAPFYQEHEHPMNCLSKCIDQCLCSFQVRWGLTPATGSSRFDYSMSES